MTGLATVESIRARFPALERGHAGQPVAYFDGPGGTQVPREVADGARDYLLHHNANTHWAYPSSTETDAIIEAGRRALADLLGGAPGEIVFGANMTTLTFHLARALGRGWAPGDEVVVTELDHHANIAPWRALEREAGVVVRTARLRVESGTLDIDHLAGCLTGRTRLVAVGAASNALGTLNDVGAIARLARDAGAVLFVDAVHSVPHVPTDVARLGCDFLACSPYKFYGPHLGVLWGRREHLETLDVPRLEPAPATAPERIETGTLPHEAIAGATAAVDFLASLAPDGAARRERILRALRGLHERSMQLFTTLHAALEAEPHVRLYGPRPDAPRTPTLAMSIEGCDARTAASRLAERGLFLSHGDFYAATVVDRLDLRAHGGLLRAGLACYSTADEIDRLVAAVAALRVRGSGP